MARIVKQQIEILQRLALQRNETTFSTNLSNYTKGLTMRNVSILSSNSTGTASTLRILAYPPVSTLQCFSIAWKIDQPWLRYRTSPVRRNAMNRDSTVSGLRRVSVRWDGIVKEDGGGLPEDVARVVGRCFAHAAWIEEVSLVFRCRDWETYRAPLIYQSEGAIVPSSPSVGILKCTISGDKPLRIHTNQTSTHRSQLLCRRNVRSGIVRLYTRLHQLPTDVPIPLTLRCEFAGLRRDRYMMRHCSRRHRAEH